MSLLDQVGGIGNLIKLATNPRQVPAVIAQALPGALHTVGRLRLLQEISSRSATLAAQCHNLLLVPIFQGRDISSAEIDQLNAIEEQLLAVAVKLNRYPAKAEEMTYAKLLQVYGVPESPGGAVEAARIGEGEGSGDKGTSPA